MPTVQVRSDRSKRIVASPTAPMTLKNIGTNTVFFGTEYNVSSALKTGELTEGQETEILQPTYVITKAPAAVGTNVLGAVESTLEVNPFLPPIRRLIHNNSAAFLESNAVGTYFTTTTAKFEKATALKLAGGENAFPSFFYDPTLFPTKNVTLDVVCATDDVAPLATFLLQLYKMEKVSAAEKKLSPTFEAALAAPLVTFTTPGAKEILHASSGPVPAPTAAGLYVVGIETITATTAAKSFENFFYSVYAL